MSDWQIGKLRELMEFGEKVFVYDEAEECPLVDIDDSFCRMLGFERSELFIHCRGKARELVYPPDLEKIRDDIVHRLETEGEYTCRYRMRRQDGVLIWLWESGTLMTDGEGRELVRAMVVNISNEESIRRERDTTYDNIPGGVITMLITEKNFYIVEANRQCIDMMGTSREEYLGSSGMYTDPDDLPSLRRYLVRQAAKKERLDFEFRSRRGVEEGVRWFRVVGRYYNEAEEGCEYLCVLLDITERRLSMLQMEQEQHRYHLATGMKASLLFEYDVEQSLLHVYNPPRSDGYIPCLEDGIRLPWDRILTENKLLYKGDYGKLKKFLEFDTSASGRLRLLAEDVRTKERSYQLFQVEAVKIKRNGTTAGIIGSFCNIETEKNEERKNQFLRYVLERQMENIYELFLQIDTEKGTCEGYFTDRRNFGDIFPDSEYEKFLVEAAENYVHPNDRERFYRSLQIPNMLEVLKFSDLEGVSFFRIRRAQGEYRYKCIRYNYMTLDPCTIFVSVQDIHSLKEEQLRSEDSNRKILLGALNEVRESMEMRRNFSSMLARELQAPIRHIYAWLRRQNTENEENREMQGAAAYIMKVVENITEYEKIEQGSIQLESREISLQDMFVRLFQSWQEKGRNQNITLTYNLNLKNPICYGDPVYISRIINHVIGNCMMGTPQNGKIAVWGSDEEQGEGVSRITLMVEDWGIPINETFFGRTYPLENDHDRSEWTPGRERTGTTFSLILARRLLELMGGRIDLSRKEDKTNLIKLEIPLQKLGENMENAHLELSDEGQEPGADLSGYSFLLVRREGEKDTTGSRLTLNGARVAIADGGMEGIRLWNSYSVGAFDAVLAEGDMGDMDYLEFTECLRQQKGIAQNVPVFAVVEEIYPEGLREGMKTGLTGMLTKPLELERLKRIMDMIKKNGYQLSVPADGSLPNISGKK